MRVLAIDQGTTSTRALLVGPDGVTPVLSLVHRQHYPRPGWVEHDPDELLANIRACLAAAQDMAGGRGGGLAALGIANQGESCLAWDGETGAPVSPVIVWQDARTLDRIEALRAAGAGAEVLARAGLPLDPYFSASKLGWILREVPQAAELLARGRLRMGTTDAFFRDRLAGRFETDVTTASRSSLMNLATCDWDPELCALFGVPMEALPKITATTGDLGSVGGLALCASVVDQQAALFGHGCRAAGDAKITFGTGAFALCLTGPARPEPRPGVLPTVAWALGDAAPVFALDGGVHAASSAVNWARGLGLFRDWAEINAFDAPPAIARGLAFVPALAGLACPHWDRGARGTWMGLSLDTGPRDMVQAVLEGVAFRTAEVLQAMAVPEGAAGIPVGIDGGMSVNPWFCQFLADALARPVRVSQQTELTALGTGQLAAIGTGGRIEAAARGRTLHPRPLPPEWRARFAAARAAAQQFGAV